MKLSTAARKKNKNNKSVSRTVKNGSQGKISGTESGAGRGRGGVGGECPEKEADKYIIFNTLSIATGGERERERENVNRTTFSAIHGYIQSCRETGLTISTVFLIYKDHLVRCACIRHLGFCLLTCKIPRLLEIEEM